MTPIPLRAARLCGRAPNISGGLICDEQPGPPMRRVRPPAWPPRERSKSMGFCFYNNVALAAIARTELLPP